MMRRNFMLQNQFENIGRSIHCRWASSFGFAELLYEQDKASRQRKPELFYEFSDCRKQC